MKNLRRIVVCTDAFSSVNDKMVIFKTSLCRWQFAYRSVVEYVKEKKGRTIWDQLLFRRSVPALTASGKDTSVSKLVN